MMKYIKVMRPKHYLKNILIFLPIVFGGYLCEPNFLFKSIIMFMAFSFVSSIVYIVNDIVDAEKDRNHPIKKNRPIASGDISLFKAIVLVCFLCVLTITLLYFGEILFNYGTIILFIYIIINLIYSFGLKNIPLIDVTILACGFILRVVYGGVVLGISISNWLFFTILSISFYMALGKRRNELLKNGNNSRNVLKYYNQNFLDKNMYMFSSLAIVFYSLWTINIANNIFVYSTIFIILILMKYSMDVESDSYGDPVDVIVGDKIILGLEFLYGIFTLFALYF